MAKIDRRSTTFRRLLPGLLFSSGVGLLAYRRGSLDRSGVGGAILAGTTIFGMGGWTWGLSLIYFFVSSSLLSHFREREKEKIAADKFSKGSQRDFGQAAANGGVATLMALGYGLIESMVSTRDRSMDGRPPDSLPATDSATYSAGVLQAGFTGALATATADTWATELGTLSRQQPRLITTWKPVSPGTSGGITLLGTGAGALGALSFGVVFWALECYQWLTWMEGPQTPCPQRSRQWQARGGKLRYPVIALISGLAGSLFDSVMGATVQAMYYCPRCEKETERRVHSCGTKTRLLRGLPWLNNDVVNFAATLFGALVAMGMKALYFLAFS